MWDQEKVHLEKFNEILAENRVRPTALLPLWNIAGFVLGWYRSKEYTISVKLWNNLHLPSLISLLFLGSTNQVLCFKFTPGASTALLGKEGAMACTVAVEESISEHYNSQIRALMEKDPERYTELLQVSRLFLTSSLFHSFPYICCLEVV